jgi:hypothetical protein
MPTQSTTYNSRVTDEALEKRFRDTFRSQGGAELVDDLYAQGVIVPIVDFTQAATGQTLAQNLQTAFDFTTGRATVNASTSAIITTAGFWRIAFAAVANGDTSHRCDIQMSDGITSKTIYRLQTNLTGSSGAGVHMSDSDDFVVFVRSGDTVSVSSSGTGATLNCCYRQIATVNGDLVDPSGFTSS